MNRRTWKRLAALRAGRRRGAELPSPRAEAVPEAMPPLESPDDDREFLPPRDQGLPDRAGAA
jgi:hypothetical protein